MSLQGKGQLEHVQGHSSTRLVCCSLSGHSIMVGGDAVIGV
ncbi:hypothetical protein BDL97_09G082700 [Sphagnum fallax]|nr:hypothetical protein BDL97_09G082700 [Sphagnum fallax]